MIDPDKVLENIRIDLNSLDMMDYPEVGESDEAFLKRKLQITLSVCESIKSLDAHLSNSLHKPWDWAGEEEHYKTKLDHLTIFYQKYPEFEKIMECPKGSPDHEGAADCPECEKIE